MIDIIKKAFSWIFKTEIKTGFIEMNSSAIKSIAYEVDSLFVLFNDGSLYSYKAPVSVFYDWLKSESKGRFFNMEVRNKFKGVEV